MLKNRGRIAAFLLAGFLIAASAAVEAAETRVVGGSAIRNVTADTLLKTGSGDLVGIFVASSTSCTIKLWDNTAGSGTVLVNTFSASAATWYPLPFRFNTGLYLDVGGTCDVTVSYN